MCSLCSDLDVSLCCEWWILSNDKILTYWHDVEFILPFVDVGYCIDWFVTSETSLRPWNKFHTIVVCDPFGKLLDLVCWCFVEDVHSYLSEVICNSVFAWFCFPCPGGFIGCTWEGPSPSGFGGVREGWVSVLLHVFGKILLWCCLVLGLCLMGVFYMIELISLLAIGLFTWPVSSWFSLGSFMFLEVCPFLQGCPVC